MLWISFRNFYFKTLYSPEQTFNEATKQLEIDVVDTHKTFIIHSRFIFKSMIFHSNQNADFRQ